MVKGVPGRVNSEKRMDSLLKALRNLGRQNQSDWSSGRDSQQSGNLSAP
jgi:hypothetical protein